MAHQGVNGIEFHIGDVVTEQVEAVFQGLRYNTSLHELNVPHTLPPVDMSILSTSLFVNKTLQDLTLGYDLDDHAMEQLSVGLQANRSVTKLTLQCHITDTGAQHFATMLAANRTIGELNLSSAYMDRDRISDHAMEQLSAGLRANRSVTRLTIQRGITDTGVHHFATMLAVNVTLQKLNLLFGLNANSGVSHLSRALQHNSCVTHLKLSHKFTTIMHIEAVGYWESITNTGAVALSEMLKVNKSLRVLDLCGTSVGKKGATALMEGLQHNQVLKELWLPQSLKEYCKKHTLYGSVKSTKFEFY